MKISIVLGLLLFLVLPVSAQQYYQQPDPQYQQQPKPLSFLEKLAYLWPSPASTGYLNMKRAQNGQDPINYQSPQSYQQTTQYHFQPVQTTEIQPYQPIPNPGVQFVQSQPFTPRNLPFSPPSFPTPPVQHTYHCEPDYAGGANCR